MRKDREKTGEEILLDAIGNLPEDMIAKAAEYSVFQKEAEEQGKRKEEGDIVFGEEEPEGRKAGHKHRKIVCRGLAAAACLALVMIAGNKGGELFRQYTDRHSIVSEKKEVGHQNAPRVSGGSLENSSKEKEQELKIWAEAVEDGKDKSKTKKESINNSSSQTSEESTDDNTAKEGKKELKEGVTKILQIEEVDSKEGEKVPVIKLTFGDEGGKLTYSLYSQVSKIISVTEGGVTKYVNLQDADCKSGGIVEFDTRRFAEVSWAAIPVPEWETKGIEIQNIINISIRQESGREQEIGKFVIGVKGEKYYGVFKKS